MMAYVSDRKQSAHLTERLGNFIFCRITASYKKRRAPEGGVGFDLSPACDLKSVWQLFETSLFRATLITSLLEREQ